jgi:hypothetical protein
VLDLTHFNTSDFNTSAAGILPAPGISVAHKQFAVFHSKQIKSKLSTYIQEMAHFLVTGKNCLLRVLSELSLCSSTYDEDLYGAYILELQ